MSQGQEKWSSVRITDSKKNSIKVENHVSIHSNLNLNGLCDQTGKEVKSSTDYWKSHNSKLLFMMEKAFLVKASNLTNWKLINGLKTEWCIH